jgi:NADPH-dependent 2,4-dienoyl-CoA reductase/sulfur reductase-like enzyme/rhodanese-related sulfurtransferase
MKYVIVGAVAGGASTAARLRRMDEKAHIILFEKGEYISYANCGLPYYIGDVIKSRNDLFVQTAVSFNRRFAVDVRICTEVTAINPAAKTITATNRLTGETYTEAYDKLVLSPGAEPIRPPLPGIGHPGIFTLRTVADTDFIKSYVEQRSCKKVVVIGGGFIGLEMAENLHELGLEVAIVEMAPHVLSPLDQPMSALVQQHLRSQGVALHTGARVVGFDKAVQGLKVLLAEGGPLDADVVILSIGVRPDSRLAVGAGLAVGPTGGIKVNAYLQTSDPDIYAVGDAIEFESPLTGGPVSTFLAGPANKQGRICADNIVLGNVQQYQGSINTAIVKVFDLTVGVAGMNTRQLTAAGLQHIVSTTHSGSHAGYYPGARQMSIQLAFAPVTGRLLGAQVVGYKGVDKRVDLLSTVIKQGGTITDLTELEHAYAPPYSSAKDPVNIAGFAAENILMHHMQVFYCHEADRAREKGWLLDVRTAAEYERGAIEGAVNIPLDELRARLDEVPRNTPIYLYCQIGLRGYLATRILVQHGFNEVYNLSGGYKLWQACTDEGPCRSKAPRQKPVPALV